MTGRAGTAKGVAVGLKNFVKGRESEGGEGAGSTPVRGLVDDGKRLDALDVA